MKPISLALALLLVAILPGMSGAVRLPPAASTLQPAASTLRPVPGQTAPAASPLVLLSAAGRRTVAVTVVADHEMVALDDLAAAFQLSLRDDPLAGGMTVSYKGKTIALMPDQPIASVSGRLVSLPAPVVRDGKRWLVPVEFISRALAPVYDVRLDLRKASRLVVLGDLRVPRVTVRQDAQGGTARVTVESSPRTASTVVQEQNRVLVRFDADALDAAVSAAGAPGLIDAIRAGDPPNTIAIVLGPKFGSFRASAVAVDAGSARVIVDLLPAGLPAAATPPPVQPSPPTPPAVPQAPIDVLGAPSAPGVRTIVIDPGHGGADDTGARGAAGTTEKDVTLSVARNLKAAVEGRLGLRVLLTRDADTAVSLDDRAAFANNNRADLFISLHANASLKKEVKGAEVFYLSPDGYAQAQQQATTTASLPTLGGGTRDIDVILWEVAQMQHLSQSATFASILEEEMRKHVPMSATPVQQAPFRVLVGANMPAVLVEMGFLTNAEQEQEFASPGFQATLVQALFDAIVRFRDTIERARSSRPPGPLSRPPALP